MMLTANLADDTIRAAKQKKDFRKRKYNTKDIVQLVLEADQRKGIAKDTAVFSQEVESSFEGMRELYDFLLHEVNYKADPKKSQWVKSPARLWSDKEGDCKSYTLFITSVLQNLGVHYIIRFVSYSALSQKPTHVYPIAFINGKQIIIDPVWGGSGGSFNTEKSFTSKQDFTVKQGLSYLSGIGDTDDEDILDVILELNSKISDSVLENDVTEMTEGELQRYLMSERMKIAESQANNPIERNNFKMAAQVLATADINGIGRLNPTVQAPVREFLLKTESLTKPAFTAPILRFKSSDEINGKLKDFFKKVGTKVKNTAQNVGEFFKRAWKKLLNVLLKTLLPGASVFFLFTFIKRGVSKKVDGMKNRQNGILAWILKITGMKRSTLDTTLKNGIIKNTGEAPEKILNSKGDAIAGWGAIIKMGLEALQFVVKAIKAIAKLFKKKKEMPGVSESDTSDMALIPSGQIAPLTAPTQSIDNGSGGGGMILPILAVGAFLAFSK